jgi:hypothetical protein
MATQINSNIEEEKENKKSQNNVVVDSSENGDVVNPWEVKAESMTGVDYDKIIGKL